MFLAPFKKFFANYLKTMRRWEKKHPVLNTLIVVVAVVMVWRGVWGVFDIYFFPNDPIVSNLLSIALGFVILLLDDFELDEI